MTVILSEVSPRDGLQPIQQWVPTETKIALVRALYEAGLRRMEVGSFVSPKAIPQMRDTHEVLRAAKQLDGLECTVLVPNRKGYELAMEAGADRLGLFMSVTESHNRANLNRTRMESFEGLAAIVRDAPKGTRIRFNLSCTFHCPFEGVVPEAEALDWIERVQALDGQMEVALADTTGNAAPDQVRRVMEHAIRSWGNRFAFHGHDTYGMGLANLMAAYEAGCRVFDAGAGGIGGCPYAPGATGNTAMEDAVWMLHRCGEETGVDFGRLLRAADLAAAIPGALPGGRIRGVPAVRAAH
ncbi:MAG: hydroxymethylglutaryl-CoA lyase [Acetobacteraceae bacterium]|nr:hydroxymethylglutaryl-CoA lyase [Acetobacteraceae bacterium]